MGTLRRILTENVPLKLFSIAIAFTLWLLVHRDPVAEVTMEVPIEFHNVPANLEISSDTFYRTIVRLRGPERSIRQLNASDIHAEIDLNGLHPGERTFDLTDRQIKHPHEVDVVQIMPSEFHIAFDNAFTRNVPVKPRVVGNFAAGLEIGQILVDPPAVSITGPQKHVEAVDAAITDPIDASGVVQQANFVRHAYVSDPLIQVVSANPVRVTVIMKQTQATQPAQ